MNILMICEDCEEHLCQITNSHEKMLHATQRGLFRFKSDSAHTVLGTAGGE